MSDKVSIDAYDYISSKRTARIFCPKCNITGLVSLQLMQQGLIRLLSLDGTVKYDLKCVKGLLPNDCDLQFDQEKPEC